MKNLNHSSHLADFMLTLHNHIKEVYVLFRLILVSCSDIEQLLILQLLYNSESNNQPRFKNTTPVGH